MSSAKKHVVCGLVSEIVSLEFIIAGQVGACLHANVIMYDALLKLGIEAELVCGLLTYDGTTQALLHFWIVFDGKEYDPTRKIAMAFNETKYVPKDMELDASKFGFHAGKEMVVCPEDQIIMDAYRQIRRNKAYIEKYLSEAPSDGKALREKIKTRIQQSVKM